MRVDDRQTVLSVDTAGSEPGVAVVEDGRVTTRYLADPRRAQAEALAQEIRTLLQERNLDPGTLDGLAVVTGPGSYTGVRVGLALVRGLALVDDLPVVGMGALDILALCAESRSGRVAAVLPANSGRYYFAVYERSGDELEPLGAPEVCTEADLVTELRGVAEGSRSTVVCADDATAASVGEAVRCASLDSVSVEIARGRLEVLARVGARRLARCEGLAAARVGATYVGAVAAKPNRNRVVMDDARGGPVS